MKKFNEAFEYIVVATNGGEGMMHELNVIWDEYQALVEQMQQLELHIERNEREIMILEDENEKSAKGLMKLMKALDKACGKIAKICREDNLCHTIFCPISLTMPCKNECEHKEYWKEWCLNDETN